MAWRPASEPAPAKGAEPIGSDYLSYDLGDDNNTDIEQSQGQGLVAKYYDNVKQAHAAYHQIITGNETIDSTDQPNSTGNTAPTIELKVIKPSRSINIGSGSNQVGQQVMQKMAMSSMSALQRQNRLTPVFLGHTSQRIRLKIQAVCKTARRERLKSSHHVKATTITWRSMDQTRTTEALINPLQRSITQRITSRRHASPQRRMVLRTILYRWKRNPKSMEMERSTQSSHDQSL